jgi:hypothetical protein
MLKLKVMTVVGTRPEIIRLSRVIAKLDTHCDHVLVHTGQNYDYELNEIFFDDLGIRKPDHFLNAAGGSGAETMGNVIVATDRLSWCWGILTAVHQLSQPSAVEYQHFTWRRAIGVSICASPKK